MGVRLLRPWLRQYKFDMSKLRQFTWFSALYATELHVTAIVVKK